MKEEADKIDAVEDKIESDLALKLSKANFIGRLAPYNKPCLNVVIGMITSVI